MNKTNFRQLAASTLLWLAACVVVALASQAAYAQGSPNKLESIDVQNLAGQQIQLTLHHSAPPSEPVAFTIDNPARISLDLANTALAPEADWMMSDASRHSRTAQPMSARHRARSSPGPKGSHAASATATPGSHHAPALKANAPGT